MVQKQLTMISVYLHKIIEEKEKQPILKLKKKEWVVVNLKGINENTKNILWDMYVKSYGSQTGDSGLSLDNYKSINELTDKYKLCWLVDTDKDPEPDAFIIYKETGLNNKISLLGSDGTAAAKRALLDKFYSLMETSGWYIEASAKLEVICKTKGFNFIDDEEQVKNLIGKKSDTMKWISNGYYTRDLTNSNIQIKKRIYGKPITSQISEDELTDKALDVAITAHMLQKRKSGEPYITHPVAVAELVEKVKKSHKISDLIAAAYLHDTIEDAPMKIETIKKRFGSLVADLVVELTSDKEKIKEIGKTEYLKDKMLNMSNWGLVIKLADRAHNTSDLKNADPKFRAKYIKETQEILHALKHHRELSKTQQTLIDQIEENINE